MPVAGSRQFDRPAGFIGRRARTTWLYIEDGRIFEDVIADMESFFYPI